MEVQREASVQLPETGEIQLATVWALAAPPDATHPQAAKKSADRPTRLLIFDLPTGLLM